ncbi:MAG: YdbL family protein [Novosphingobium sp.]
MFRAFSSRSLGLALAGALTLLPGAAMAQSDPAYAAARSAGQAGERYDGYIEALAGGSAVKALVDDLNIKRRAAYFAQAKVEAVPVDQIAFVAGCRNILNTVAGEKYQAPDGTWQTRGAGAPLRDSRCP